MLRLGKEFPLDLLYVQTHNLPALDQVSKP